MWEYQWHAGRRTYERVCFQPIQICEPTRNPIESIQFSTETVRVEDLDLEVQQLMNPAAASSDERQRVPPPRPPPVNFGRRAVEALSGEDRQHAIALNSPTSPDPSSSTYPVDTPTKRPAPSPTSVSPSRVRCDSPVYIPLQDHIALMMILKILVERGAGI